MKNTKIKLAEIEPLHQELAGLLSENLPFTLKYEINKILESTEKNLKSFLQLRLDLFKKFGKKDPRGNYSIEKSEIGLKEYNALLDKEEILSHKKLEMEDFKDLKSDKPYQLIYKLF